MFACNGSPNGPEAVAPRRHCGWIGGNMAAPWGLDTGRPLEKRLSEKTLLNPDCFDVDKLMDALDAELAAVARALDAAKG